jgi:hypothetical protein
MNTIARMFFALTLLLVLIGSLVQGDIAKSFRMESENKGYRELMIETTEHTASKYGKVISCILAVLISAH